MRSRWEAGQYSCTDSRGNAWKEIEPPYLSYEGCSDRFVSDFGLFFNGVIHWLASRQDVLKHVIVAFDLTERDFSDISLPVNFVYASFKLCFVRKTIAVPLDKKRWPTYK